MRRIVAHVVAFAVLAFAGAAAAVGYQAISLFGLIVACGAYTAGEVRQR